MDDHQPFASLSAGLLARKGQARPAMRPQGFGTRPSGIDDLGWNDVGVAAPSEPPVPQPSRELPPTPVSRTGGGDKAAFTLRLSGERHLKLRLACALHHRSAQQIVTDALDAFLDKVPDLDALAGAIPGGAWRTGTGKTKKG